MEVKRVMTLIRRDVANELKGLQEDFNRFFGSSLPRLFTSEEGLLCGSWNPTVDIYENSDGITLEADLPGMKPGDFDLSVENNTLTLRGERRFEKKNEGDNYHRVERSYGSFTRSFAVQQTDSIDGVTAGYDNGILRIDLPKREEVKARRIEIVGQGSGESRDTRTIE